jgi:hypothetical protein
MFRWRNSSRKCSLRQVVVKPAACLILFLLLGMSVFGQNDPYGAIKETMRVFPDKSSLTLVTDPEKHSCEETLRDAAGKTMRRTVYPLNDQNIRRGALHYDAKGVLVYKEVYVYDYTGRITESKLFTKDNQPKGKLVYVYEGDSTKARIEDYDEFGNLITPAAKGRKH